MPDEQITVPPGTRLWPALVSVRPDCVGVVVPLTRPARSVASGCGLPLGSGPVKTSEWKTMSWSGSLPGPGGWLTVKVGKVNVAGRLPVVKSTGAEPVPSLNTCRIW